VEDLSKIVDKTQRIVDLYSSALMRDIGFILGAYKMVNDLPADQKAVSLMMLPSLDQLEKRFEPSRKGMKAGSAGEILQNVKALVGLGATTVLPGGGDAIMKASITSKGSAGSLSVQIKTPDVGPKNQTPKIIKDIVEKANSDSAEGAKELIGRLEDSLGFEKGSLVKQFVKTEGGPFATWFENKFGKATRLKLQQKLTTKGPKGMDGKDPFNGKGLFKHVK